MIIRAANAGDREALASLRVLMLEYVIGRALSSREKQIIDSYFRDWDGRDPLCLVAEEGAAVVGCIAASFYQAFPSHKNPSGLNAILYNFVVYEEHRGKGIGRSLFARVLKECKERGTGRISLYATDMGQPIYGAYGFSHEVVVWPEMRLYYKDLINLDLD